MKYRPPLGPSDRQIRFVRMRLVTRLHKGSVFFLLSPPVPPSPLPARGPASPPFDDALTERGCRPSPGGGRQAHAGSLFRWRRLRRGVRGRNCLFVQLLVARERLNRMGQRTAAARTWRGGAWGPRVTRKVELVFDEMPDFTSPMAFTHH